MLEINPQFGAININLSLNSNCMFPSWEIALAYNTNRYNCTQVLLPIAPGTRYTPTEYVLIRL